MGERTEKKKKLKLRKKGSKTKRLAQQRAAVEEKEGSDSTTRLMNPDSNSAAENPATTVSVGGIVMAIRNMDVVEPQNNGSLKVAETIIVNDPHSFETKM